MENLKEVVDELNDRLWNLHPNLVDKGEYYFSYEYFGMEEIIKFNGNMIWSPEFDKRKFIEKINDYEPMIKYLGRSFKEYSKNVALVSKIFSK